MIYICTKELIDKVTEIYEHISKAKDELELSNYGNVRKELNFLLTNGVIMAEDDGLDMNDTITCILTEEGAKKVNAYYKCVNDRFPNGHPMKCDYKEGDLYENQFWSALSIVEPFSIGQDVYFKNIKKKGIV